VADARVSYAQTIPEQPVVGPSVRQMLILWLPLAASIVMMVLEPSTINVALGRTADPELALAAYGVAFSLALLVEAPIIMLLDASVARSADRAAFQVMRRFTLTLGFLVTGVGLLVSLTPLYGLVVRDLMNIPPDVAVRARPTLQILSFWSLPIAWRRAHQGVLIRTGRTGIITVATGVRLVSLAGALYAGLLLLPHRGAVVAGLAMVISVTIEAVLITWATRPVLRADFFQPGASGEGSPPLTMRGLWHFYRPLATSTILNQTTRPVLNSGIAAAGLARASLAAWPVTWGFAILVAGPAWSLQQLTTALAVDDAAYRRVRRFSLALSALFSLLLALVAFTPLYGLVMGGIYNLSPTLQDLARPPTQLMSVLPLLIGTQSVLRGVFIRNGCTGTVRAAMTANVLTLVGAILVGVKLFSWSGVMVAAVAVLAGGLVEIAWLRWRSRC
jgi:O-antigen/teichoic acid export membrane protein